jgi:hypothetical protein
MPFSRTSSVAKRLADPNVGHMENLTKRIFAQNNRMLSIKPNAEHAAVELWHLVAPWFHG